VSAMKIHFLLIMVFACLPISNTLADSEAVVQLLGEYAVQGANKPSAEKGRLLWERVFTGGKRFPERSCTSCHRQNLKQAGRHVRTKKSIEPMAPSVNPERLTSVQEISKWFKRNCKWTIGRECTASEKASLLAYLKQQ